jgi:hypothetical protein
MDGVAMTQLPGDELSGLGRSMPTGPLIMWATEQLDSAKGKEHWLLGQGINESQLTDIRDLIEIVNGLQAHLEQESQLTERLELGVSSESLAKFDEDARTLSRISRTVEDLKSTIDLIRKDSTQPVMITASNIGPTNGSRKHLNDGPVIATMLQKAQNYLDLAFRALSGLHHELSFDKGRLYNLTCNLARLLRQELLRKPVGLATMSAPPPSRNESREYVSNRR